MLPIRLSPDKDLRVESIRIGNVPTLILRPAKIKPVSVGVLWIHGGGFILGMKEMAYMGRAADLVKSMALLCCHQGTGWHGRVRILLP